MFLSKNYFHITAETKVIDQRNSVTLIRTQSLPLSSYYACVAVNLDTKLSPVLWKRRFSRGIIASVACENKQKLISQHSVKKSE